MASSLLLPPETARGMTTLDKSKFEKRIRVPVIQIKKASMSFLIAVLKPYLLKMDKFKPVQLVPGDDAKEKLVFLNPDRVSRFDSFDHAVKMVLADSEISADDLRYRELTFTYDNWKCHDVISAILPPELNFSGFSVIGAIVHVNLKGDLLAYKCVIGQVLLEKLKNCKSVVRKVKNIENTFRNFEIEVLAGSDDLETEVKENGCRFRLDFAEVYWNPRLHDEHGRILRKLRDGDVLYDVFCGVGPFAVPAARVGCEVLANDLNPRCCHWLRYNAAANKVPDERLRVYNKSGDDFIRQDVRQDLLRRVADESYAAANFHVTMNLPATATTFLSAFVGLFDAKEAAMFGARQLPVVHLYCFVKGTKREPELEARNVVERILNVKLPVATTEVLNVRNVAPRKDMIRVSFKLPKEVLCGDGANESASATAASTAEDAPNLVEVQQLKTDNMEWESNGADAANNGVEDEECAIVVKRPKLI